MISPASHSLHTLNSRFIELINRHPTLIGVALAILLASVCLFIAMTYRLVRFGSRHGWAGDSVGTLLAAAIATCVSAQGMWIFMGDALHLSGFLRCAFFSFLEIMVVTSALRARTAQRVGASGSVDGIAMWMLTCLSAVLSATNADNVGTLLFRLSAPLVAAWGWERSMAIERHVRSGRWSHINWTITPERLLVRLGVADPNPERTASDADSQRKLIAVALAVDDARTVRESGDANARRLGKAQRRLQRAMRRAAETGALIPTEGRDHREVLLDHIAVLRSAAALLELDMPNPWSTAQAVSTGSSTGRPTDPAASVRFVDDADEIPRRNSSAPAATGVDGMPHLPMHSHAHGTFEPHCAHLTDRDASARSAEEAHGDMDEVRGADAAGAHRETNDRPMDMTAPEHTDAWAALAERICGDDPARRRNADDVQEILRLWHVERRTYPQIAKRINGYSRHAVGRVIRQARKYHGIDSTPPIAQATGGRP